jgi:hypothetical protein
MSNWVIHPSRGTVRFCYTECDERKEGSIFVTLAPDLTELTSWQGIVSRRPMLRQ